MAAIKALEGRTVHQIQSGQVIVDLCSVVKELVENSLDAGATSIDVRFKNNGLEAIEVQDNGIGISRESYETIALKHYTSKLSSYHDLTSLQTFGFRGEALSSLCALSTFHVVTARADEAPKGTRLDFEISGKLKGTQVVASQKGTTVTIENLFVNLPVRRRELEKNIKREYGKVLGVLQAYACISTQARISASNVMAKGKKAVVFATKPNQNTRDNIANIFGAKALTGLVAMDLDCEMQPTKTRIKGWATQTDAENKQVRIVGHVSRPIFGEGRQAPDRQMFFVNSRPCSLPQVAKVFNEVYKSYNIAQSPFVFANIILDTNAYDVNVSPDKRTILLHDQNTLLETLKTSLTELFEKQDQTVPQTERHVRKLPTFKQLSVHREASAANESDANDNDQEIESSESAPRRIREEENQLDESDGEDQYVASTSLIAKFAERDTREPTRKPDATVTAEKDSNTLSKGKQKLVKEFSKATDWPHQTDDLEDTDGLSESNVFAEDRPIIDFNQRIAEQQSAVRSRRQQLSEPEEEEEIAVSQPSPVKSSPGVVQSAYDRMRPRRDPVEVATITIGSNTTTSPLRPLSALRQKPKATPSTSSSLSSRARKSAMQKFSSSMKVFTAPGAQIAPINSQEDELDEDVADPSAGDSEAYSTDEGTASEDEQSEQQDTLDPASEDPEAENDDADMKILGDPDIEDSDGEYLDEEGKKAKEDARVATLIHLAEEKSAAPSQDNVKRAHDLLKGGGQKDSTTDLIQIIQTSVGRIDDQLHALQQALQATSHQSHPQTPPPLPEDNTPEERLSLTVSKQDFSRMRIIGQFNLGFILAVRPSHFSSTVTNPKAPYLSSDDELFIIDQHASDEKSNFERLQFTTVMQHQRLVHPKTLDLTAIEEEIILEHNAALLHNGFVVSIDESGDVPVGRRCKLLSLPMSKEVTFDLSDLEELIALLADAPPVTTTTAVGNIPRPSKTRRLFAMRACRSSVMIGKPLSIKQMEKLVRRMGEIEKPWNCPHGRPTMRHVMGLGGWQGWGEGDGVVGTDEVGGGEVDWKDWIRVMGAGGGREEDDDENGDEGMEEEEEGRSEEEEEDDDDDDTEEI